MKHNIAISTLVGILRREANHQRHEHGELVEREGGLQLTPSQMEKLADWLLDGRAGLSLPVEVGPEKPRIRPGVRERLKELEQPAPATPQDPYLEEIMARKERSEGGFQELTRRLIRRPPRTP